MEDPKEIKDIKSIIKDYNRGNIIMKVQESKNELEAVSKFIINDMNFKMVKTKDNTINTVNKYAKSIIDSYHNYLEDKAILLEKLYEDISNIDKANAASQYGLMENGSKLSTKSECKNSFNNDMLI